MQSEIRRESPISEAERSASVLAAVSKSKILIVDDRPENLLALEAILEPLGHNLVRASSGREALKRLLIDEFALILLDVQMPEMDGFEAARLIKARERSRHIPIIFITAISKDQRFVFQGYSVGAVDYISKPLDPEILRSKVTIFVELHQRGERIKHQAELLRQSELGEAERLRAQMERDMARRHMAELARREAQLSQFQRTLDATLDAVLIFEPGTIHFNYVNQGAINQLGYDREELLEMTPRDICPDFDEHILNGVLSSLMDGRQSSHTYETLHRRKDGVDYPAEISLQYVADEEPGSGRFIAIVRDIRERKEAQEALARALEKEKRVAETLQGALLFMPPDSSFPGLTIAPFYKPAWDDDRLGGDFYDAFAYDEGRVALVVGDVAGKGLAAAARTAEVKFALRAYLKESDDPAVAVARLNSFLCESQRWDVGEFGSFVCLAVVLVDTERSSAAFTVAGTEPPLLLHKNGECRPVELAGMPLGISSDAEYTSEKIRLSLDDTIVLLTDGITEAKRGTELFGYKAMARAASQVASAPAREIGEVILESARDFAGGKLQDDVCLLLARRVK
ncbi:MAG TPA: SpoIIE family protein phosphatase [Capsulimonadaceae bacterium]|nr:SpoIIE family protein phosphatase [Capsulimonadaceae bacterium]